MIIFELSFIFLYLQTLTRFLVLQFHYHKLIKYKYTIPLTPHFLYYPTSINFMFYVNSHINFFSYFHVYGTSETCMVSQLKSYKAGTISSMQIYLHLHYYFLLFSCLT